MNELSWKVYLNFLVLMNRNGKCSMEMDPKGDAGILLTQNFKWTIQVFKVYLKVLMKITFIKN